MDHKFHSIFDRDIFTKLTEGTKIAQCMKVDEEEKIGNLTDSEVQNRLEDLSISETLFCSFCNVGFEDKVQQRLHYKLDWHRYNLKQNLMNRSIISEEDFQQLADDVSSISGSESESDEEDESSERETKEAEDLPEDVKTSHKFQVERHSKVFFENADKNILSVYRCILIDKKAAPEKDEELISLLLKCGNRPKWSTIMLGGGHFAAAIFNGHEAVVHKTFHSYTVRARQGGTQSSRDGRTGGSHPKSAGASLRRFNEASFNQHVQDILTEWSAQLEACSLIFYRAVGHNRTMLFGGRSPLFSKNDSRFRSVPFPTRRATYKELCRVHGLLSSVEIYGSADQYQTSFPQTPRKKQTKPNKPESKEGTTEESVDDAGILKQEQGETESSDSPRSSRSPRQKKIVNRAKSRPSPRRPLPTEDIPSDILAGSSPEHSDPEGGHVVWRASDTEICLAQDLQEYEDTVPQRVKELKMKKFKKPVKKKKKKVGETEEFSEAVKTLRKKLLTACKMNDLALLKSSITEAKSHNQPENSEQKTPENHVSDKELLMCLNERVSDDGNTLLHIVAENGNIFMLRFLMESGCDPSTKNKKFQPPFALSADRETRNAFRKFMGDFPDKYDYNKSQIPGPLNEDSEKQLEEKRKIQKKAKREREKERKKDAVVRQEEETEKDRFLKLSDREKRALAAERRILASNAEGKSDIKIVARCFECAADITGKVPFEYDIHRFCSIDCLKKHRLKLKAQLSK